MNNKPHSAESRKKIILGCVFCNSSTSQKTQKHGGAGDLWIIICPDCRQWLPACAREVDMIERWNEAQLEISRKIQAFWDIWDAPENEYLWT